MSTLPELFESYPAVYAVADRYIVTVPVTHESVMWVKVGERCFYDDSNGILRSASMTHKMELPQKYLDEAREYTVCWRIVNERKPYFADLGDVEECTFSFRPVTGPDIRIYHIADAHNRYTGPIAAGTYFGDKLDVLVLNGDIPNHSGDIKNFTAIHMIAGEITHGELPVIFSRGNHDTRGIFAEALPNYTPTDNGKSYFTVHLGPVWALVLDCAEDKPDTNAEYGHTICCHDFRLRETEFLRELADEGEKEFNAPGVEHRLVIAHCPFSWTDKPPFDIEQELYTEWCEILREKIHPELMLCGHVHKCYITLPGEERDHKGQPCPVVCASRIDKEDKEFFVGGAITLSDSSMLVEFTDNKKTVLESRELTR